MNGLWSDTTRQDTATIGLENGEHQSSVRVIDHHFNTSSLESLTIIVKTELPVLKIVSPVNGDVIAGQQLIKGEIKDDDFEAFQVFLSDLALTEVPIFEEDAPDNLQKIYQLIYQASARPRTATLAKLETKSRDDGDYKFG